MAGGVELAPGKHIKLKFMRLSGSNRRRDDTYAKTWLPLLSNSWEALESSLPSEYRTGNHQSCLRRQLQALRQVYNDSATQPRFATNILQVSMQPNNLAADLKPQDEAKPKYKVRAITRATILHRTNDCIALLRLYRRETKTRRMHVVLYILRTTRSM